MPDRRFDLIVLGAGAAGMLTALVAARNGMAVAVIDPHFSQPNNLWLSGGLFPAAGSSLQSTAGVADSPEDWLADLRAFAGNSVNERIASAVARALPLLAGFMVDQLDAPIRFLDDVPAPGHRVMRFHSVVPASGRGLHAWLRQATAAAPAITCFCDRAIDAAERGSDGFEITLGDDRIDATRLMLAGGGFGASAVMVENYIPGMRGAIHNGAASNDGSVITIARRWGAALAGMGGYQGQGHANPGGRTRLGMSLPVLGAILVNRDGRRFVNEDIGPSALAARVLAQPGQVALEVFDAAIEAQLANHSAYAEALAAGQVVAADSVAALATAAGVDAGKLQSTLAECSGYAQGSPDPLGRARFAHALAPPYRASWVTGTLSHTQGGVVTDAAARVLDAAGNAITGLYAAGGSAAGLSGTGGEGYLPGNGLAQSFGLAWLAVQDMCG
jgi:fumarate reductase flavoprotein subunit